MNPFCLACILLSLVPALANADDAGWQRYVFPQSGASVEIPIIIFSKDAGAPEAVRENTATPATAEPI